MWSVTLCVRYLELDHLLPLSHVLPVQVYQPYWPVAKTQKNHILHSNPRQSGFTVDLKGCPVTTCEKKFLMWKFMYWTTLSHWSINTTDVDFLDKVEVVLHKTTPYIWLLMKVKAIPLRSLTSWRYLGNSWINCDKVYKSEVESIYHLDFPNVS